MSAGRSVHWEECHTCVTRIESLFLLLVVIDLLEESRDDSERIVVGVCPLGGEALEEVGLGGLRGLDDPVGKRREDIAGRSVLGFGFPEEVVC